MTVKLGMMAAMASFAMMAATSDYTTYGGSDYTTYGGGSKSSAKSHLSKKQAQKRKAAKRARKARKNHR